MTHVRAALLPLSSTLHRHTGPAELRRTVAGRSILDHQIALLRATGHAPVVLLGEKSGAAAGSQDVVWAKTAGDAANALAGVDDVTVLGHGVLMGEGTLRAVLGGSDALPVRCATPGWERIDGETHWAGALSLDGDTARSVLADLGEWDAQATLLRVALQRSPELARLKDEQVAHGFDGGGAGALFAARTERRLVCDDGIASAPIRRWSRSVARSSLEHPAARRLADGVTAVTVIGAAVAGWTGWPTASALLSAAAVLLLAVALAIRRAAGARARSLTRPVLGVLALLPGVAAWRAEGGALPLILGAGLGLAVLVRARASGLPSTLRLDIVFAALAGLSWLLSPTLALAALTSAVAAEPLLRPSRRRTLLSLWRGSGD